MTTLDWEELTLPLDGRDPQPLLATWAWRFGDAEYDAIAITMFGDWFFRDDAGAIWLLDTAVSGTLEKVAESDVWFRHALRDPAQVEKLLMASLVVAARQRGLIARGNQCLDFIHPPQLGGALDASNLQLIDLAVHLHISGQIFEQVAKAPPGGLVLKIHSPK